MPRRSDSKNSVAWRLEQGLKGTCPRTRGRPRVRSDGRTRDAYLGVAGRRIRQEAPASGVAGVGRRAQKHREREWARPLVDGRPKPETGRAAARHTTRANPPSRKKSGLSLRSSLYLYRLAVRPVPVALEAAERILPIEARLADGAFPPPEPCFSRPLARPSRSPRRSRSPKPTGGSKALRSAFAAGRHAHLRGCSSSPGALRAPRSRSPSDDAKGRARTILVELVGQCPTNPLAGSSPDRKSRSRITLGKRC